MSALPLFATPASRELLRSCGEQRHQQHEHSPYLHNGRFLTLILCRECRQDQWSLAGSALVSKHHQYVNPTAATAFCSSSSIPVLLSDTSPASLLQQISASSSSSSLSLAMTKERFQRLRISVVARSQLEEFASDQEGDGEVDALALVLWPLDASLNTILDVELVPSLPRHLVSRAAKMTRRADTRFPLHHGDPEGNSMWMFPLEMHGELVRQLNVLLLERQEDPTQTANEMLILVDAVPEPTLRALVQRTQVSLLRQHASVHIPSRCTCNNGTTSLAELCNFCTVPLYRHLMPHQRRNAQFALQSMPVRVLDASDPGTGKTMTSLAIIGSNFEDFFPVLVVCPALARTHWAESFEQWLGLAPSDIHVVFDGAGAPKEERRQQSGEDHDEAEEDGDVTNNDEFLSSAPQQKSVIVISFSMLVRLFSSHFVTRRFRTLIVDESHNIRPASPTASDGVASQQAQCCASIAKNNTAHAIFLSGIPFLSKPFDVFGQIDLIRPGLLGSSSLEYAANYLTCSFSPFFNPGACHRAEELRLLLSHSGVMMRAERHEALKNLPPLVREVMRVKVSESSSTVNPRDDNDSSSGSSSLSDEDEDDCSESVSTTQQQPQQQQQKQSSFQRRYQLSGLRKVDAVFERVVAEFVDNDQSNANLVVIFAHHRAVLDRLEALCRRHSSIEHVRIDGSVAAADRHHIISKSGFKRHQFQPQQQQQEEGAVEHDDDDNVDRASDDDFDEETREFISNNSWKTHKLKIALVSMTAAGVALSFNNARVCFFAELPPDSTVLIQCEGRLHRLGQQGESVRSVLCLGSESIFDAKQLATLMSSMNSVAAVSLPQQQQQQQQQQRQRRRGKKSSYFSSTHNNDDDHDVQDEQEDDDREPIKFLVSHWTSRLHLFANNNNNNNDNATDSLYSCAFDELFSDAPPQSMLTSPRLLRSCSSAASLRSVHHDASEFVRLFSRSVKPAARKHLVPMTLAELQREIARSGTGFLAAPRRQHRHPRKPVFERYLSRRLTEDEKQRWCCGASDLCGDTRRFVVEMRYELIASTTRGRRQQKPEAAADAQQQQQEQQSLRCYDLLVEVVESHDARTVRFFCLQCQDELNIDANPARSFVAQQIISAMAENTGVVDVTRDFAEAAEWVPFCSGECRNMFLCQRAATTATATSTEHGVPCGSTVAASQRLRRELVKQEKGVCAVCGIDTIELLRKLRAIQGDDGDHADGDDVVFTKRMEIIRAEFPLLLSVRGGAAAATRISRKANPVSGDLWQADHVVPVSQGGGAAVADEMQTLCTACHLAKTQYEVQLCSALRQDDKTTRRRRQRSVNK